MSEICDGPLCYRAMVVRKTTQDVKGDVCVYLRYKRRRHIFAIFVNPDSESAKKLIGLKVGDEVFVPYSCEMVANVVRHNFFMRLWNRLFW